jgi:L-ascorbate metabolism protein UlaG (beta-lactamase superfamily)
MKMFISSILLLIAFTSSTQLASPDVIKTDMGDLEIQPIMHGSLVLTWNDQTIYVDPYGGAERFEGLADPTVILITDIHGDHLNQNTLNEFELTNTQFFVPQEVYDKLPEEMQLLSIVISNGESENFGGMKIAAIPMYNLPEDEDSRHTKGRGNGYILTMGGKKIYLSGDTEDIPEMRALKKIDVAFVCMNLPFTMDVKQAASAVNEFKPAIVYPYHYRGREGLADVEAFKQLVKSANPQIDVRLKNWYPE